MNRHLFAYALLALALSGPAVVSAQGPTLAERAEALERASSETDGTRVVLGHISRKLAMPAEKLRTQRAATGLNWGDLLIANLIAFESRTPFDTIVAEFNNVKTWEQVARNHKIDPARLDQAVQQSEDAVVRRAEDRAPRGEILPNPQPGGPPPVRLPGHGY